MTSHSKILIELNKFERRRLKPKKYFTETKLRMRWTKLRSIDYITIDEFEKGLRANIYEIKTEAGAYDTRFFEATGQLEVANLAIAFPRLFFIKKEEIEALLEPKYYTNYLVIDHESALDPEDVLEDIEKEVQAGNYRAVGDSETYLQILAEEAFKEIGLITYDENLKFQVYSEPKSKKLPLGLRRDLYNQRKVVIDKLMETRK